MRETAPHLLPIGEDELAAHRVGRRHSSPRLWPWVAGALVAASGAAAALLLEHVKVAPVADGAADPMRLVLPGVALVVTVALFFAARALLAAPRQDGRWHEEDRPGR